MTDTTQDLTEQLRKAQQQWEDGFITEAELLEVMALQIWQHRGVKLPDLSSS